MMMEAHCMIVDDGCEGAFEAQCMIVVSLFLFVFGLKVLHGWLGGRMDVCFGSIGVS